MKLIIKFPLFIAILALMTSCVDEATVTLLDKIQVSSSYVSIPVNGGSDTIAVTAKDSFTVVNKATWLTISSMKGTAGESTLIFTAASTLNGRTTEVLINCGDNTQRINIIQGLPKIETATCAQVIAGLDSKIYLVTGVCSSIPDLTNIYGNWYLKDNTGTIYIYGTLDAKGATKNFLSLGLEVGDEITVQGPKTTYNGTVELVNVTVLNINKSLVKVDSVKNAILPGEGGEYTAYITCKGQGLSVSIPDDAKSWLSISSIQSLGLKTTMKFKAVGNTGENRSTTLTFSTTDGTKSYSTQSVLKQRSVLINATVAEFIAAPVSNYSYRLSGSISKIDNATTGLFYLKDLTGEVYVYKITDFATKNKKVGDNITIIGTRAAYNGTPQVNGAVIEN